MRVFGRAQADAGVVAREVEQLAAADEHGAVGFADRAAAHEVDHAVADRSRMNPQCPARRQELADRVGQGADAELEHAAVGDERGGVTRDRAVGGAAGSLRRRARGLDVEIEVVAAKAVLRMRPRHLRVHFGDDRAAHQESRDEIVGGETEAVFAALVGRAHLDEDDISGNLAGANEGGEP